MAAAGAAGAVGISVGGVAVGVLLLMAVAVQLLRVRRSCPGGLERRRVRTRLATLAGTAAASFATVQWVIVPLLSSGGGSSTGQLP